MACGRLLAVSVGVCLLLLTLACYLLVPLAAVGLCVAGPRPESCPGFRGAALVGRPL